MKMCAKEQTCDCRKYHISRLSPAAFDEMMKSKDRDLVGHPAMMCERGGGKIEFWPKPEPRCVIKTFKGNEFRDYFRVCADA